MQEKEMRKFVIKGAFHGNKTFPSLNNLLTEYGKNPRAGGAMKKKFQNIANLCIRKYLRAYSVKSPIILHYKFYEPSRGQRRDFLNIFAFADKIIEDALQDCKVIPNDNPDWVLNATHEFLYTNKEPYIEVYIEEVSIS